MQFGSVVVVVLMQSYRHMLCRLCNWCRAQSLVVVMGLGLGLGPLSGTQAATLTVAPGTVTINVDGVCALPEALINANDDRATHPDCPAGSGADTIALAAESTYTLTDAPAMFTADGPNGLPSITTAITLHGNGAIIERSTVDGTPAFRLLHVAVTGDLTVSNLTIRRGTTSAALDLFFPSNAGGGLLSRGTLTFTHSTISASNAFIGGGLAAVGSTVTCRASTLSSNHASEGGGLAALDSTVTVLNSTVSGNHASGGGGLAALDSTVTVLHSTVSGNSARLGGGLLNEGTVTLSHTILANNAGHHGNCAARAPHSGGHNLASEASCQLSAPGDRQGVDPRLGSLATNGGPTQTHALLAGSPAIDAGDNTVCPATDQRGVSRPQGDAAHGTIRCDIGAFEVVASPAYVVRDGH